MAERDIEREYLKKLEPFFEIHPKVSGKHFSGETLEIDAIVSPKDKTFWKKNLAGRDIAFGIEFKDIVKFKASYDTKNYTKWLAQSIDYAHTNWNGFGYLYIFTCPGVIENLNIEDKPFIHRFMGQLGVGELLEIKHYGLTFLLKGGRIWSELKKVECGDRWSMQREFGSR